MATRCVCGICQRVYTVEDQRIDKDGFATWRNHFFCSSVCCSVRRDRLAEQERKEQGDDYPYDS
jgi:hypothetical protein